jgi:hypothetical protein
MWMGANNTAFVNAGPIAHTDFSGLSTGGVGPTDLSQLNGPFSKSTELTPAPDGVVPPFTWEPAPKPEAPSGTLKLPLINGDGTEDEDETPQCPTAQDGGGDGSGDPPPFSPANVWPPQETPPNYNPGPVSTPPWITATTITLQVVGTAATLGAGLLADGAVVGVDAAASAGGDALTLDAAENAVTVTHFTSAGGADAITNGGSVLNAGSYVTTPGEVAGMGASQVESTLEIGAGKGAFSSTFQTPASNLTTPANGAFTSGGATQFQLISPTPVGPFVPTPP